MKNFEIGQKIRKVRELKNFKQEYVAGLLGISAVAYGKIERGDTDVKMSRLVQLAEIFEVSLDQLLLFDEKRVFNLYNNQNAAAIVQQQRISQTNNIEVAKLLHETAKLLKELSSDR